MLKLPPDRQRTWSEYEEKEEIEKAPIVIDEATDQRAGIVKEAKKLEKVFLLEPDSDGFKTEEEFLAAVTDVYEFAAGLRSENIEVEVVEMANAHSLKRLLMDRRRHEFAKIIEQYLTQMRQTQADLAAPKEHEPPKFRRRL